MDTDHRLKNLDNNKDDGLLHEDLTYRLQKTFYNARNKYGQYHKENIYQKALKEELDKENIKYIEEPPRDRKSFLVGSSNP